ncbi:MAG: peptidoglycan-associated lipoprotein Pal [Algicola sp.]|nr:peptidoglycan-associated lipoprotein Pal [Algicola sp.]
MQLNKVLKGLLIAIPVMALTACSSSSNSGAGNSGEQDSSNNSQVESNNGNNDSKVAVGTVERPKSPEEVQEERDADLRQTQTIYFEYDKNNVQYQYNDLLAAHARFLVKNANVSITIEGHCDERGTPEYNIALGERRAKSVSKYLTTLGVSSSQINIVSYGEEKPTDKSRTESGFAKNRRAILVY